MFNHLKKIPLDPILSLVEEFKQDCRPEKINLTIGVYANEDGKPTVFEAVKIAEERIQREHNSKSYFPIKGPVHTLNLIAEHVLGAHTANEVVVSYGSGGTGALRLAAEVINMSGLKQRIWICDPTWEAHNTLFNHCKFEVLNYSWIGAQNEILFEPFLSMLKKSSKPGDWIVLHACCHNPTGIDPTPAQWDTLLITLKQLQLNPLFDVAYHGFGVDLDTDIQPVRSAFQIFDEMIVCYSFSKMLGLYNERCGALIIKTSPTLKEILDSNVQRMARLLFSNPPAHGLKIIDLVMSDSQLYTLWLDELATYNQRLKNMRSLFSEKLAGQALPFDHIARGKGIFAMTGLSPEHVLELKTKHAIYLLKNGRINIAGLNLLE